MEKAQKDVGFQLVAFLPPTSMIWGSMQPEDGHACPGDIGVHMPHSRKRRGSPESEVRQIFLRINFIKILSQPKMQIDFRFPTWWVDHLARVREGRLKGSTSVPTPA